MVGRLSRGPGSLRGPPTGYLSSMLNVASHAVDSELGRWRLAHWRPAPNSPLAGTVAGVWDFEGMVTTPRERVFPNGSVELLIQLDDRYYDIREAGKIPTPTVCVTGVHTQAFVIEAPPRPCRVIGIRLRPPGAWALLEHPMSELADLTADLEEVLGRQASELAERCHGLTTGGERIRCVADWLAARLPDERTGRAVDPAVRYVAESIVRSGGRVPIGQVRSETGLSSARLNDRFRRQVGVTPKRYARVHRFQTALRLLNEPGPSLGEVALAAGYYDQPHMNTEFRRMAGLTPGAYVRSRRFPASTHLAEASPA